MNPNSGTNHWFKRLTTAVGFILTAAGIFRAVLLNGCPDQIATASGLSASTTAAMFLGLIILQIGGGAALAFRFRIKLTATVLLIVPAVHLVLATLIHARQLKSVCPGAGLLGISLSPAVEGVAALITLDILAGLVWLELRDRRSTGVIHWMVTAGASAILVYAEYSVILPLLHSPREAFTREQQLVDSYRTGLRRSPQPDRILQFVMSFHDFNCPPCLEDFLILTESLQNAYPHDAGRIGSILFQEDDIARRDDPAILHQWAESNRIRLPLVIVSDSLMARSGFEKSYVLLLNAQGVIVAKHPFPLGEAERMLLLKEVLPSE